MFIVIFHHSYLYVLQICIDIRENRVLVDGDDASHLVSLLLQGTRLLLVYCMLMTGHKVKRELVLRNGTMYMC